MKDPIREVRFNALYKDCSLNDIEVIETDIGMFCVMDKEVVFTNTEDGRFTIGVKLKLRQRRAQKLDSGGMEVTYFDPEWYGAFVELDLNQPISKITDAINECIDINADGIKQMYAQPRE